jgi:ATP-dependent DNA helicase 2 subunit 1
LTANDDPAAGSVEILNKAKTRARDLVDLGVQIEPFAIQTCEAVFDFDKFYADVQ